METDLKKLDRLISSTTQTLDTLLEKAHELGIQLNDHFGPHNGKEDKEDNDDDGDYFDLNE
ncbi:MAG: hypothetical protein WCC81_01510 [Pseudolabrys sp.]